MVRLLVNGEQVRAPTSAATEPYSYIQSNRRPTRAHPSLSLSLSLLFSFIFGSNNCFVFTRQMCVAYVCRVLYSDSLIALRPNMEMREGIILTRERHALDASR